MQNPLFKLWIIPLIFLFSHVGHATEEKGFDQICTILSEVDSNPEYKTMSAHDKAVTTSKRIKASITSKDAIQAFASIGEAAPEDRYNVFKASAEYSLKHKWDCPVMKKIYAVPSK